MQKYHNFIFGIEGYCNFLAALFEPICWIKGWIPEMVKYVLFSYVLFEKKTFPKHSFTIWCIEMQQFWDQ